MAYPVIEKGIYIHTKSDKQYEVLGVAFGTETSEFQVIYRPLYKAEFELFARPYEMFVETIEIDGVSQPRFTRIED